MSIVEYNGSAVVAMVGKTASLSPATGASACSCILSPPNSRGCSRYTECRLSGVDTDSQTLWVSNHLWPFLVVWLIWRLSSLYVSALLYEKRLDAESMQRANTSKNLYHWHSVQSSNQVEIGDHCSSFTAARLTRNGKVFLMASQERAMSLKLGSYGVGDILASLKPNRFRIFSA